MRMKTLGMILISVALIERTGWYTGGEILIMQIVGLILCLKSDFSEIARTKSDSARADALSDIAPIGRLSTPPASDHS